METGQDVLAQKTGVRQRDFDENRDSRTETFDSSSICLSSSPCTESSITKRDRKVSFPDDSCLVSSVEPYDPWKDVGNFTSKEVIDAYRKVCTQLKVKPCEKLIKQLEACENLNERIDVIDLRGTKLDLKSCETLEEVLRKVRTKTLDLENTNLEDEGTLSILEMVEFYHSACKLNLAYNNKIRVRGWQALARTLKRTPCLEYLDVRHTVWTEQSIPLLGRSLRLNCPLTILHMEATNLSGRPLFLLANAVKSNQVLKDLFLGDNRLVPSDGQCIGAMLKNNTSLRLLDLRNNTLQDMGLGHICEGLSEQKEDGLQTLVLWNNQLTFQGMGYLAKALVSVKSLQTLNLGHNRLTNEGIHNLKDGLLMNKSLQRLGLLNTRLSSEGIIALAEVIADSQILLRLDIRENDPYVGGLMALSLSLKMNHSLVRIDLDKELKKEPGMETTQRCLLADIYGFCQRNKNLIENNQEISSTQQKTSNVIPSVTLDETPSISNSKNINIPNNFPQGNSQANATSKSEPTQQKSRFDLKNLGNFSFPTSRFRITRIFESSTSSDSSRRLEGNTQNILSNSASSITSEQRIYHDTIDQSKTADLVQSEHAKSDHLELANDDKSEIKRTDLSEVDLLDQSVMTNFDQSRIVSTDQSHDDLLISYEDSSSSDEHLLDIEPNPPQDITAELDKLVLPEVFDSDSSSSQDIEWESRMGNYACGSRDSVDSIGTPISKSDSDKEHTVQFYERELDALLASNPYYKPAGLTNNENHSSDNDDEFWTQEIDAMISHRTNSNPSVIDPPTADLLGS